MRAGKLRHLVSLQQPASGQDAHGQPVTSWTDVAQVYAEVAPLNGREYLQRDQVSAEVTTRIRIRAYAGLGPTWRVVHEGVNYNIAEVIDVDRRGIEMVLMCRSGVNNG